MSDDVSGDNSYEPVTRIVTIQLIIISGLCPNPPSFSLSSCYRLKFNKHNSMQESIPAFD